MLPMLKQESIIAITEHGNVKVCSKSRFSVRQKFAVRVISNPAQLAKLIAMVTMGMTVHGHKTELTMSEANNIVRQTFTHVSEYG